MVLIIRTILNIMFVTFNFHKLIKDELLRIFIHGFRTKRIVIDTTIDYSTFKKGLVIYV